jgi:hypothetical protein
MLENNIIARPLSFKDNREGRGQTSMTLAGFEPSIPEFILVRLYF